MQTTRVGNLSFKMVDIKELFTSFPLSYISLTLCSAGIGSVIVDLVFNVIPSVCGVLCLSLFCYALLCVHYSFAIILKNQRKLVALLFVVLQMYCYYNKCCVALLQGAVGWSQYVIMVFPDHTHFFLLTKSVLILLGIQSYIFCLACV